MNKLRVTTETPRDTASYAYDIGKYSIRRLVRRITEVPQQAPSPSSPGPARIPSEEATTAFLSVLHETQSQQLEDAA